MLDDCSKERCELLAEYIIGKRCTVRYAASVFGVSKSTVHKDITEKLEKINPMLCREVGEILKVNKSERHIRGGLATKEKFSKMKGCGKIQG